MVIVRSKEDLSGEEVAEVRKEAGSPQIKLDLSKLDKELENERKRAYGLLATLTIDENDLSRLLNVAAQIQRIDYKKDFAVRDLSFLRGAKANLERTMNEAKAGLEKIKEIYKPSEKAALMSSYLINGPIEGLEDRKKALWLAEGSKLLDLYEMSKSGNRSRVDFPSPASMINTLEKWLNLPICTKYVLEHTKNLGKLYVGLTMMHIDSLESQISGLDSLIEKIDSRCDEMVHRRRPAEKAKSLLIKNSRSPLEDLTLDERRQTYESAKNDSDFVRAYNAYRKAVETTQSEESDALREVEFNELFVKYYLNGSGNGGRLPTIGELKKENGWLYLLLRVNDTPKSREDKGPLSVDELFELDDEPVKVEEIRSKTQGLFSRFYGGIKRLFVG